ncbi:hypothetical protein [Burkholderia cepacia]|uniref:hypothetical protein n=1 Tax=Burkholderia cepacia TaxID=292 RepID=UPI002AB7CCC5|nr:hypothetical protein [Burkholderia cepacia]
MSHRIEYQARAFRIPKHLVSEHAYEDYFMFALEGGDNNLIDERNRPVRRWSALSFEMHYRVIEDIVRHAIGCEGGSLKWLGRDMKPENYIRVMRRVVDEAPVVEALPGDFQLQVDLLKFDQWKLSDWKEKVLAADDAEVFWQASPPGKTFGPFESRWDYQSPPVRLEGSGIAQFLKLSAFDTRHISAQVHLSLPSSLR